MKRVLIVAVLACAAQIAQAGEPAFDVSYAAGATDASGQRMGGSEIRNLVAHGGMLFAANGYWKDQPGFPASRPGAQILVLDGANRPWRVDHAFDERLPDGRRRHLAMSALGEVTFRTDPHGAALTAPVRKLLTSTWDVTGRRTVFVRDDRTGAWPGTVLARDPPSPGFLPQIRAFGFHRDGRTGADLVFAGDTFGIFSGGFDPAAPGQVSWTTTPELSTRELGADQFPGLGGRLRISSFAEARGRLFAAIGQQVWVRQDGPTPQWQRIYTNPSPHYSQMGLRGLTTISDPGKGESLLAAVEGYASRIVRIDPTTGAETTDLDLDHFLDAAWATKVSYVVAAYNDMARISPGNDLLIGFETFFWKSSPRPPGHSELPVNSGLEAGAWFLIRHPGGHYELHQVTSRFPGIGLDLVSVRTFAASPFPGEAGAIYLGGYDANDAPAHDTAWIARLWPDRLR